MAISCELCGGKLIMRAGGIATCDICGLEYSLERMRELLNMSAPQPIHTEQKATASNVDDDIFSFDAPAPAQQAEVRLDNSPIGALATVIDAVIEKKKAEEAEDTKASAPAMDDDIFDLFGNDAPAPQSKDQTIAVSSAVQLTASAETELELGRYNAALEACERAIDADRTYYKAVLIKAKALCAMYPDGKTKIYDIGNLFTEAEELAPESERPDIKSDAEKELSVAANRTVTNMADEFIRWPDEPFHTAVNGITTGIRAFTDDEGYIDRILSDFSVTVTETVEKAFSGKIMEDYRLTDKHPNQIKAKKFASRAALCIDILELLITPHYKNKNVLIPVYQLLIKISREKANCTYWSYESQSISDSKIWISHPYLTKDAIRRLNERINNYKEEMMVLDPSLRPLTPAERKKLAEQRFEEYWKAHAKEKEDLLEEKELIKMRIYEHKRSINLLPAYKEEAELAALLNKLNNEKRTLTVFKSAERNAIQSQIDQSEIRFRQVRAELYSIKESIDKKITELEVDIANIDHELTRER